MRLLVVGCGDVGGDVALGCRLNPRLKLVATVDPDIRKAQWLLGMGPLGWLRRTRTFARLAADSTYYPGGSSRRPGAYTSLTAALAAAREDVRVDAVHLGVPHDLHEPMVRDLVAAGLPVLCEKPLAHTLDSGREIAKLAEREGAGIGINYQYRYDPHVGRLRAAVRDGALGELRLIRAVVPWHRGNAYFTQSSWHAETRRAGGGTLITQGSHAVDAALWIAGVRAVRAHAVTRRTRPVAGDVEDLAVGNVELEGGALLQIASTMAISSEQPLAIELYGSRGSALYTAGRGVRTTGCRLPRLSPAAPGLHPIVRSLEGFRRWIEGGPPYLCTPRDALATLSVVDSLYRAAESGCTEEVIHEHA